MNRWLPVVALTLLVLSACATTQPVASVDPTTDPTAIGAIDEAAREASIEGAQAAKTGRRIGRVAGVLAAVFGGPECESVDDMVDRYRFTRDTIEITSAAIGASKGARAGATRGHVFDLQFAELRQIEGVEVFRPYPDVIDVQFASAPSRSLLAQVAAVFTGREDRVIDVDAAGEEAFDVRDALIDLGLPAPGVIAHRNDERSGIALRVRYRD